METLCHRLLLSRSLYELGYLVATRSLSSVSVPRLHGKKRERELAARELAARSVAQEGQVSILKNPGVVTVAKLSKEELCNLLSQNVVYKKGPLVAINKPQGLSISGNPNEFSVSSLLPELQHLLGISSELHVLKAASKESSGLVLLSTCHATSKRFEEFYAKCRKSRRPVLNYCAVTVGVPSPQEGVINMALKIEQIGDHKLVVPVIHPTKGSLERREVKKTETHYRVLDSTDGCALLQLQPMSVFQSQLVVHMAWKLCKVLGDHTYSTRVGKVLGEPIHIPVDSALPRPQMLEEEILRRMHLLKEQIHKMPLHLHLHELLIPCHPEEERPQILSAPLPPFFKQTIQLLGLTMKEHSVLGKDRS